MTTMQLSDTSTAAEEFQIDLIRRSSISDRIALMQSLSVSAVRMSRMAIARAHPRATDMEVNLMFLELHYGKELANGVRKYLVDRK